MKLCIFNEYGKYLKGTVSQDFLLCFFHLYLTPRCIHYRGVKTPRCIHHQGVMTTWRIHHWGVETPQCINHRGVDLNWLTKEPASAKHTRESRLSCD
jgi:hypothetical protein